MPKLTPYRVICAEPLTGEFPVSARDTTGELKENEPVAVPTKLEIVSPRVSAACRPTLDWQRTDVSLVYMVV